MNSLISNGDCCYNQAVRALLAKFLIPHSGNNHYPHSIRPNFLAFYLAALLSVQLVYNFATTGEIKVLSFATDINQPAIVQLSNAQRQANGVGVLQENSQLDQVAKLKAQDMFANNYWAHVSPGGVTPWYWYDQVGYKYLYAGENLARDFDTSAGVIDGWMNSPSHRDNLLSPNYTEIGVAVVNGFMLGHETTLVVQEFGRPQVVPVASNGQLTITAPAPAQVAPQPQGASVNHQLQPSPPQPNAPNPTNPQPVVSNPYVASPQQETDTRFTPSVLSLNSLNSGQKMMLAILIPILAFFLFDGLMLLRKNKVVIRGHSLTHAALIGLMIAVILTGSIGVLR